MRVILITCEVLSMFQLVSKAGRVMIGSSAHKGAVLGTRWGHDGTTLLTCKYVAGEW